MADLDPDGSAGSLASPELRERLRALFDPAYYLERHPEVARSGEDPLEHFIAIGARIGCDPHPLFDVAWYRSLRPELAGDGVNPLLHYLEEGGKPEPPGVRALSPHPLFDTAWYRAARPEVALKEENPLLHFLRTGAAEGTPPNPLFDAEAYRQRNSEVGDGPLGPILHLVHRLRGRASGRAYHYDRRETAPRRARDHGFGFGFGRQATDAPCALWETHTRMFAPEPGLPGMEDAAANPVQAYRELCPPESTSSPPEIRFACSTIPRVSVFVPVSTSFPNTVATLRSLAAARTYTPFDVHLVVADEPRAACLKRIGSVPGAIVVEARDAGSVAAALNRAALDSERSFVTFLGCGTIVTDGWLDALFESFDGFPGAGLAGSALVAPRALPSLSTPARDAQSVPFGALLLSREVLDSVGGLPDVPLAEVGAALSARVRAVSRRVVDQAASLVLQFPDPDGHPLGSALHAEAAPLPTVAPGRRALFVDVCTPTPGRDARSLRIFRVMQMLREQGVAVTFAPANLDAPAPERQLLRSHGYRVAARPEVDDVPGFAERPEEVFDLCWVCRPGVARKLLEPLRRAQPRARFVFDAADLVAPNELDATVAGLPGVDALVLDPPADVRGAVTTASPQPYGVPKVYAPPRSTLQPGERFDAFFVGGFQSAPALDGLLWFLNEVLPRVLALDPGFRVHVPIQDWSRVFTRANARHRHIVLVEDRDLQSPWFVDHFRLVVAPLRFGPGVSGLLQMALARGVPCVSTSVASLGVVEDARSPLQRADTAAAFVEAICSLHDDAWSDASEAAERAVALHFVYDEARERVASLCDALGLTAEAPAGGAPGTKR